MAESDDRPTTVERVSFSCSDEVWGAAKRTWAAQRRVYLVWAKWLEAALSEKTQRTKAQLGLAVLEPAPERLPPGRRQRSGTGVKPRRSFTCSPPVWQEARDAWYAELEEYPAYSDWVEEAVREKAEQSSASPAKTSSKSR